MNRRLTLGTMALALAAASLANSGANAAAGKTFPLHPQNGSGEKGTVTLIAQSPMKTLVLVNLTGAGAAAEPAHIHPGSCAKLDPAPKYPLHNVVGGKSSTMIDEPIAMLAKSGFAVNVHKSTSDLTTYVACGNL